MNKSQPIAVVCADLHLSLQKPPCRAEKDWMEVQAGYLEQLCKIADYGKGPTKDIPILCAGDIFDKWNPQPELINFALEHLPTLMMCIPGQHDLPNHRLDEIHRSGYEVLARAGKIWDMSNEQNCSEYRDLCVYPFPWGAEIKPPKHRNKNLKIALVHRYLWMDDHGHPKAKKEDHILFLDTLNHFNVVISGDNHIPFHCQLPSGTTVFNCGGFIRRKADELHHNPRVGLLYADGTVKSVFLDTSADKLHEHAKNREAQEFDMRAFIEELEGLGEHGLDFREAVRQRVINAHDVPTPVRRLVLLAMEESK